MEKKCDYCGSWIDDTAKFCTNCGAPNNNLNRTASDTPRTIEELRNWYMAMNLPPEEVTRFFIGKNISEPRAFGIYRDSNGEFVVYKNKDTGERAIRYRGNDEGYAVNELYMRLKSEILKQKSRNTGSKKPSFMTRLFPWLCTLIIIVSVVGCEMFSSRHNGYYVVNSQPYYYYSNGGNWFTYDYLYDDWVYSSEPYVTEGSVWDYQYDSFENEWDGSYVESSAQYQESVRTYEESSSSDSSWDSSDSWDSGSTDWGSDW